MKYFKDDSNRVFAFSEKDLSLDFVKERISTLDEITEEEKEAIINQPKNPQQIRQSLKEEIRKLREKEILTAEIEYKDKKFKADRGTALEVNAYINAFQRALPLGLRQQTDIVARWRTQDNSYIDLYLEDMISISLLQTQVVATAFAKQEALELQLSTIQDEELLDFDVEEFWSNVDESASSIS
ncbi:DUF4376 domain-containing protein [Francisella hispaniensis]|uniref:DUF4376 domain-containing protein n=1 Tax=Francisella hispaniensis TaxID=622488 RepID=F4BFR5_9GAMM|nr:DUF4376 domain-containing protein [Francisella hispaniensis]AEE26309.1 hypothetical protein FN3523_1006 [Francisella hispaniensis]